MTEAEDKIQIKETLAGRGDMLVPVRDYRFTSQCNQGGFCWTAFNELLLCKARLGAEDPKCIARHKNMLSQCPSEWVDKWTEQSTQPDWTGVSEAGPAKVDHGPHSAKYDAQLVSKHKGKGHH